MIIRFFPQSGVAPQLTKRWDYYLSDKSFQVIPSAYF